MEEKNENMYNVKQSKIDKIFTLVQDEKEKVFIAIGNNRISNAQFDTFKQAEEYIGRKPYELIFNIAYLIAKNLLKEYEKTKKTTKKTKESK